MNILLRNKSTGLYYVNASHWTSNASEAHPFPGEEYAISRALAHRVENIELEYQFPEPRMNFTIPVTLYPDRSMVPGMASSRMAH